MKRKEAESWHAILSIGDSFINSMGNYTTIKAIQGNGALQLVSATGTFWVVAKEDFINRVRHGNYTQLTTSKPYKERPVSKFEEFWEILAEDQNVSIFSTHTNRWHHFKIDKVFPSSIRTMPFLKEDGFNKSFSKRNLELLFDNEHFRFTYKLNPKENTATIKIETNEKNHVFKEKSGRDQSISNLLSSRKRSIAAASRLVGNTTMYCRKRGEINTGEIKQGIYPYLIS